MLQKLQLINVKYTLAFISVAAALIIVVVAETLLNNVRQSMMAFRTAFSPAITAVLNADRDLYQARVAELTVLEHPPGSEAAESDYADYQENADQAHAELHVKAV